MANSTMNAYALLGILQDHAPNGKAQQACVELHNSTLEDERELRMACALTYGLLYGDWPWTKLP